jgi:hypothetical protein
MKRFDIEKGRANGVQLLDYSLLGLNAVIDPSASESTKGRRRERPKPIIWEELRNCLI